MFDRASVSGSGEWYVALAERLPDGSYRFRSETEWGKDQRNRQAKEYVGDFNGDRKSDRSLRTIDGDWSVALSDGKRFESETSWGADGGEISSSMIVADFDGDGRSDRATIDVDGQWTVALTKNEGPSIVGAWYMTLYGNNSPNWHHSKIDPDKVPVVGWGGDTLSAYYSSEDTSIISRQLSSMKKACVDLVIVDLTNLYFTPGADTNHAKGRKIARKIFEVMSSKPADSRMKIAIALGAEFWGKVFFDAAGWKWTGWDHQYEQQRKALDAIKNEFVDAYPDLYFVHRGRPLVLAYLNEDVYYPPYENEEMHFKNTARGSVTRALWHFNDFTVQPVVGYHSENRRRLWTYGALWPQLPNKNSMTVMPGRRHWGFEEHEHPIRREEGTYYIRLWKDVLNTEPRFVFITDWNNWNEEYAVEGCTGRNGWRDSHGNLVYDWYLQITRAYASALRGSLPRDTYVMQDGLSRLFRWNGVSLEPHPRDFRPIGHPIVTLPANWLEANGYEVLGEPDSLRSGDTGQSPSRFMLNQNWPNPFNHETTVRYSLDQAGEVLLEVYDLLGRRVGIVKQAYQDAGEYEVRWKSHNHASGTYFLRLRHHNAHLPMRSAVQKMVVTK